MKNASRPILYVLACIAIASAATTLALTFSTRSSIVNPLNADFPTAPGQKLERTVMIRRPGRYFLRAEFDALGPLEPVFRAFGTSKEPAIPSDIVVELGAVGAPTVSQELRNLTAATSSGGAEGRLGFTLAYADLQRGPVTVKVDDRGGLVNLENSHPRLELTLSASEFEALLWPEQISLLVSIGAITLTGLIFVVARRSRGIDPSRAAS